MQTLQSELEGLTKQAALIDQILRLDRLNGGNGGESLKLLTRDLVYKLVEHSETEAGDAVWDLEAVLDRISLTPKELMKIDNSIKKMTGNLLVDIMQMIKSEFKLSIGDDTEADTSTLMLDMLPIPSQRKLQRWVEARAGKGGKAKGGVGDMGGVGGKKGSLKKQRKDAVKKETGAVKKESDQSARRPTATFVYRQHVLVEWKAEDDMSPATDDDRFECKVIANRDTTPGTFRVQYKDDSDKKGRYTGDIENNVPEHRIRAVRKKTPVRKRKAAAVEEVTSSEGGGGDSAMDIEPVASCGAAVPSSTVPSITALGAEDTGALDGCEPDQPKRQCQRASPYSGLGLGSDSDSDSDSDEEGNGPIKFDGNPNALDPYGCCYGP
mmetsp:Transcript_76726/g.220277  ORF Transcript_76726/g.220277 Transcript_76726/m.220277 type:complete len:381 (+) Transcript_76726:753-1895(+)